MQKKIEQPDFEHFKKIKGTEINSSQVVKDPIVHHGSPCTNMVTNTSLKVKISKKEILILRSELI